MPEILFVKPTSDNKRIQICVGVDGDVSVFTVKEDTYNSLMCPAKGDSIDERTLDVLRFEDEIFRAVKKALTYISDLDRSAYALKVKLLRAGFSRDAADAALERCTELGYLDEDAQLDRAVEREANFKLRGKYHIRHRLAAKGYSVASVDRAIARLVESGEVDFDECFERLAEKRGAETDEERLALKYKFGYKI